MVKIVEIDNMVDTYPPSFITKSNSYMLRDLDMLRAKYPQFNNLAKYGI